VLVGWLEQMPLLCAFQLDQKGVNIVVVWRKSLFALLFFLNFLLGLLFYGVGCDVSVDSSVTLEDFVAKAKKFGNTGAELVRPRQTDTAPLGVKKVEQKIVVNSTIAWINSMPLPIDELHNIKVMTVL
jgi:hypothetical protein